MADGSVNIDTKVDESGLRNGLSKLSSVASGAIGGLTKVLAGATAAIAALATASVNAYADYEQLLGGIETLFGTGGKTLEEYAASVGKTVADAEAEYNKLAEAQKYVETASVQAYKTAGLSMNEYMETVTSFSASLKQSCDTELEAAEAANQAVIDMADNANKMGTSMELIQNAYQGFAKQNYTMLDNLKLGYGGTKEEMQRLLADAQKLTGIEYDISNLADVYEAIHVIQTELGITGTTAEEAADTISGSVGMMKASWANLVTAMASEEMPLDEYIDAFVESVEIAAENILPVVETALGGIAELIGALAPMLVEEIPNLVGALADGLLPAIGEILAEVPMLIESTLGMAIQGLDFVANNAEAIIAQGASLVAAIGNAIITAVPQLVGAAASIISSIGNVIAATDWIQVATDTIAQLRECLSQCAAEILGTDGSIVESILESISTKLPDLISSGGTMVASIVSGIFSALPSVIESALELAVGFITELIANLPNILSAGQEILGSVVEGIRSCLPDILASAGEAVSELLTGIVTNLPSILQAGIDLVVSLIEGIGTCGPDLLESAGKLLNNILTAVGNIDWLDLGCDIVNGLINGIGSMGGALWTAAKNLAKSALNAIKSALGIASPSKVFRDEVGKWIPVGLADGIAAESRAAIDATQEMADEIADVDFTTQPPDVNPGDGTDYAALVAKVRGTTQAEISETGTAVSAGKASEYYRQVMDDTPKLDDDSGSGKPQYIRNDIYIEGRKAARILTPYIVEELEWEGK